MVQYVFPPALPGEDSYYSSISDFPSNLGPPQGMIWQILSAKIHFSIDLAETGLRRLSLIGQSTIYGNFQVLLAMVAGDVTTAGTGNGGIDGVGVLQSPYPLLEGFANNILGNGDGGSSDFTQYAPIINLNKAYLFPGTKLTVLGTLAGTDEFNVRFTYLEWGRDEFLEKIRP